MSNIKVTSNMARDMRSLRRGGWSYDRIADHFGVSRDTVMKHAPGGKTIRQKRNEADDQFTREMLALGEKIITRLRAEGKINY